jgi:type IV pilus assembly protein PilX
MRKNLSKFPHHQRGAVLVVSLLMLLVMTILGVAAMQMTRFEERMAGNSRDINIAFQGAEAGLRDGESRIAAMLGTPAICATAPCTVYQSEVLPTNIRDQTLTWWRANGIELGVAGTQEVTDAARDPIVIIEEMTTVNDSLVFPPPAGSGSRTFFKVTASSAGANAQTEAVLETTYARPF